MQLILVNDVYHCMFGFKYDVCNINSSFTGRLKVNSVTLWSMGENRFKGFLMTLRCLKYIEIYINRIILP